MKFGPDFQTLNYEAGIAGHQALTQAVGEIVTPAYMSSRLSSSYNGIIAGEHYEVEPEARFVEYPSGLPKATDDEIAREEKARDALRKSEKEAEEARKKAALEEQERARMRQKFIDEARKREK